MAAAPGSVSVLPTTPMAPVAQGASGNLLPELQGPRVARLDTRLSSGRRGESSIVEMFPKRQFLDVQLLGQIPVTQIPTGALVVWDDAPFLVSFENRHRRQADRWCFQFA